MPHKRNPVAAAPCSAAAVAGARAACHHAAGDGAGARARAGGWHAEWATLPELALLAARARCRQAAETVEGLEVDRGRMRANLGLRAA